MTPSVRRVACKRDTAPFCADLQTLVMGLHWTPTDEQSAHPAADLDALCVLFDAHGHVLEVVHPGHMRSSNDAVVHTGDSLTGASAWDDERIFVFFNALPPQVSELALMVASSGRQPFEKVRGASCHISDYDSDTELLRVDLTAFAAQYSRTIAIARCSVSGWRIRAIDSGPSAAPI